MGLGLGADNVQDANNLKDTSQIESPVCIETPYMLCSYPIDHMLQQAAALRNIFDDLPTLAPICGATTVDELTLYLSTGPENVTNALQWWHGKRKTYPHLSRMALDYLTIPG